MSKSKKILIFLLIFCINIVHVNASIEGNKIADTGAKLACGIDDVLIAEYAWTRIYDSRTKLYVDARESVSPVGWSIENSDGGEYADCAVAVSTMVRYSGVDKDFPTYLCPKQWEYLTKGDGKKKWKRVGTYYIGTSTSKLKPGDVMIVDPNMTTQGQHIWLYLGNKAVRKYWPNSNADAIQASYASTRNSAFYPSLFNAEHGGDTRPYAIFRYNGKEYVQKVLNWAKDELAKPRFTVEKADVCKLISDNFKETLTLAFKLLLVIAIILVIILTIIDLIKIIISNPDEKFQEFGKHIKARIITLVILLVLPLLLTFILNMVNNIATISGYNADNPLCGINENKNS